MIKESDVVYQIFVRNYSENGTFKEITNDLNRIKSLGVTIIYLLPIHEIGVEKRKGNFGSPYSIRDYFSISKDLGNYDDFKELVDKVHKNGLKIILDMVFNHTSYDAVLTRTHPEFYFYKNGKRSNRVGDWSDICDLDTFREDTKDYLMSVIDYWVSFGVDGFRFDVASLIDIDFFVKFKKKYGNSLITIGESIDSDFQKYLKDNDIKFSTDFELGKYLDCLYSYNYFVEYISYLRDKCDICKVLKLINESNVLRLCMLENHDTERIASIVENDDKLLKQYDFIYNLKGVKFLYFGQEYGATHKPNLFEKDPLNWNEKNLIVFKKWMSIVN